MYSLVFTSAVIVGFGCIGKNGDDGMSENKRFKLGYVCEVLVLDVVAIMVMWND